MPVTTQTVRDIALENPASVRVFEKYGIDYCCGGRVPLADACQSKGLNMDEVLASLEAVAGSAAPAGRNWKTESLANLTTHIVDTHHAYVKQELPRLYMLAEKVVNRHGNDRQELPAIQAKLTELGEELTEHMGKEEAVLFPYLGKFERYSAGDGAKPRNCFGSVANPIAHMTQDHDVAGNLMAEISNLSQKYTPPESACPTYRAFYSSLQEFERDLHQHVHLENNILFPRAIAMEATAA